MFSDMMLCSIKCLYAEELFLEVSREGRLGQKKRQSGVSSGSSWKKSCCQLGAMVDTGRRELSTWPEKNERVTKKRRTGREKGRDDDSIEWRRLWTAIPQNTVEKTEGRGNTGARE